MLHMPGFIRGAAEEKAAPPVNARAIDAIEPLMARYQIPKPDGNHAILLKQIFLAWSLDGQELASRNVMPNWLPITDWVPIEPPTPTGGLAGENGLYRWFDAWCRNQAARLATPDGDRP